MPTVQTSTLIDASETAVKNSAAGHLYNAESFDNFIPAVRTPIHSASGGLQLQNIPCGKAIIRNASGNNLMFIGGIGQQAPYSGRGISIYGGETVTWPIKNTNRIAIMAGTSGQFIEYGAWGTGDESSLSIDLSGIYSPPTDTTPPTILSVAPVSGVSGVEHNATISATFSESMNEDCINTTTFTVRLSGAGQPLVSGIVFLSPVDDTNAIFSPYSGQISGSLIYVARIAGGISGVCDLAGNMMVASAAWHWTTLSSGPPPDTTLPRVSGTNPASGAIDVGISSTKQFTFSEALQSGSVSNSRTFLRLSGNIVPATTSLDPDLITVRINPTDDLGYVKTYEMVVLSGGVKDLAGNNFSGTFTSTFTTREPSWNTPYVVALEDEDHGLDNDKFRVGERMTTSAPYPLSGRNFQKVTVYLAKQGSPISGASGARVQIRKDDGTLPTPGIFGQFNPALLTTDFEAYSFVNTDISHLFGSSDKIEVEWLSGTSSDRVLVGIVPSNEFVGGTCVTYEGATYSGASYLDHSTEDLVGIFYSTN